MLASTTMKATEGSRPSRYPYEARISSAATIANSTSAHDGIRAAASVGS